ncbi:MAG: hypothetical protein R3C39_10930 [Dehalococcoidia bacterium]
MRRVSPTVLLALLLAACSAGGDNSTSTATVEAAAAPTSTSPVAPTVEITPHPEWTPAPQPSLEELYEVTPYFEIEGGGGQLEITRIPPPSIEAAEAEGPRWLGNHAYTGGLPRSFEGVPGSAEPHCVEVGREFDEVRIARSNDWVLDTSRWNTRFEWQLMPVNGEALHGRGLRHPLLLRATYLAGEAATHVIEVDGGSPAASAQHVRYVVPVTLPLEGRWLVAVTAGPQWGCFVVDAPAPLSWARHGASIEEIEAAGALYPAAPPPDELPSAFFTQPLPYSTPTPPTPIAGFDERRCVDGTYPRRSGEFVFYGLEYESQWRPDVPGMKTAFTPLHQPEDVRRMDRILAIRATLLDDPRHTYVHYPYAVYGINPETSERGDASWISSFVLPREGRWAIVATAGPDWGCFVLDLRWPRTGGGG